MIDQDQDLSETDSLIDGNNEYFALMCLQGAIRHLLTGKPFDLGDYRAVFKLEWAQRDVMSAAVSKHVHAALNVTVAA